MSYFFCHDFFAMILPFSLHFCFVFDAFPTISPSFSPISPSFPTIFPINSLIFFTGTYLWKPLTTLISKPGPPRSGSVSAWSARRWSPCRPRGCGRRGRRRGGTGARAACWGTRRSASGESGHMPLDSAGNGLSSGVIFVVWRCGWQELWLFL
jgi:hypothetical protein